MFISPFDNEPDFTIRYSFNENAKPEKVKISELVEYFEVKFIGTFDPLTKSINYDIWERKPGSSSRTKISNQNILLQQILTESDETKPLLENPLGPFKVSLYYYPRNEKTILDFRFQTI